MEIREAVEADAERMADIADSPPDVMRNLVHDRTVRVAQAGESDGQDDEDPEIVGLVSFDARDNTVHVTQLAGSPEACKRLLEEPVGFARGEGMAVELLVSVDDDVVEEAVQSLGFQSAGSGPQFEGQATTRYRLEPGKPEQ